MIILISKMNSVKEMGIKNHNIFDNMINIKSLDLNIIKVHENSYEKSYIYYLCSMQ